MQTHGIIGERVTWSEGKGEDRIDFEGLAVAAWAVGGCIWVGIKTEGIPHPVAMQADDLEFEGWG